MGHATKSEAITFMPCAACTRLSSSRKEQRRRCLALLGEHSHDARLRLVYLGRRRSVILASATRRALRGRLLVVPTGTAQSAAISIRGRGSSVGIAIRPVDSISLSSAFCSKRERERDETMNEGLYHLDWLTD